MDTKKTCFGYVNKIFIEVDINVRQNFPVVTFSIYDHYLYTKEHLLILVSYPSSGGHKFYSFTVHGRGIDFGGLYSNQLYHESGIRKKEFKKLLYSMYDKDFVDNLLQLVTQFLKDRYEK